MLTTDTEPLTRSVDARAGVSGSVGVEGQHNAGDLGGLDNVGLTERLRDLELEARRVEADLAGVISEGQRRGVYADDSHTSLKGWLKANVNWSNSQAFRRRRLARLIEAFPTVGESLRDGHIGVAQVDELARVFANPRVTDRFAVSIEVLLNLVEQLSFEDARTCLKRWEMLADLDGAHRDRAQSKAARTATVTDVDGALFLKASGGAAEDAAEMIAIFDAAVEAEFQADVAERTRLHGADAPTSLLARTDAQRRFDAIQTIFRRSVSVPADAKPPKPLVNLIVDQQTFEEDLHTHGLASDPTDLADTDTDVDGSDVGGSDVGGFDRDVDLSDLMRRRCETSTGIAVLPDVAIRAALHGHIRRIVVDSAGVVTNMGRKQRLFTGAAREAAKLMARSCQYPGCDVAVTYADVDHLDEWERDHGETDPANSSIACNTHNRAKHRNQYQTQRRADGQIIYHRPDGTPMLPVGQRPPPETDEQTRNRHLEQRIKALCKTRMTRDKQLDARTWAIEFGRWPN